MEDAMQFNDHVFFVSVAATTLGRFTRPWLPPFLYDDSNKLSVFLAASYIPRDFVAAPPLPHRDCVNVASAVGVLAHVRHA